MNITIIGMMGCGKTTIGQLLAEKLNFNFVDTDRKIIESEKQSINDIFINFGEEYFRNLESKILQDVLETKNQVISTGGGIIKKEDNLSLIVDKTTSIYLQADSKTLYNRVKNNKERPLLHVEDIKEKISTLLKERENSYKKAHITINTIDKTPEAIVNEIIGKLNEYSKR